MRPGGEGLAARLNSSLLHLSCSTFSSSARPAREAGWKWYMFVAGSLQIDHSAQITKWKRIGPATTWMVISDYLISKTLPRGVYRYSYVPPDTPLYSSRCLCTHHLAHTQMHACPYTGASTHILQCCGPMNGSTTTVLLYRVPVHAWTCMIYPYMDIKHPSNAWPYQIC